MNIHLHVTGSRREWAPEVSRHVDAEHVVYSGNATVAAVPRVGEEVICCGGTHRVTRVSHQVAVTREDGREEVGGHRIVVEAS